MASTPVFDGLTPPERQSSHGRGRMLMAGLLCMIIVISAVSMRGNSTRDPDGRPLLPLVPLPTALMSDASVEPPVPTAGHQRMLDALDEIKQHWGENPFAPFERQELLLEEIEQLKAKGQVANFAEIQKSSFILGTIQLKLGSEQEAIGTFSETLTQLTQQGESANSHLTNFWLGVAYLRMAETQNCCSRHTPDSCLIPIKGQGIHTRREGSTKAIECFMNILTRVSPGSGEYHNAIWLLNIAHMTLGDYPDGVPKEYLIPPKAFASEQDFPRFMNVAQEVGLTALNNAGGVVTDDFNNDGHLDVLVSEMDLREHLRLWLNKGDGTFVERTRSAGLTGLYGGLNLVQADYNNDGALDVLVLRGAWMRQFGCQPNSLLRNNGDGTFSDVTFAAGLGEVHYPTQAASWADFDNDGDVDLYIGNESDMHVTAPGQLFRNNGDETFTDIAQSAGVTNDRYAKAVVWGDYDQDRLPDLYVSNLDGDNRLYHNNGDGTFTDLAPKLGVVEPTISFPVWFWDFNNDGALDLYASAYQVTAGHLGMEAMGHDVGATTQKLYQGDGKGGFRDVTEQCGLDDLNVPMGANFGDLNNDGFLDFYLGTGRPDYWELMPNLMYLNRGGKDFADVTTAGGFGSIQKGHGVAFADLDHDGDQDVFSQLGGAFPGDKYYNALYQNPGFGNHFLTLKLVGTKSNRSAIGARIRIDISEAGATRTIYKHVNSGGSFGASPLQQTVGLGKATAIERLEIYWPTTGESQAFDNVPLDQHLQIVEGLSVFTVFTPPAAKLAAAAKARGAATE